MYRKCFVRSVFSFVLVSLVCGCSGKFVKLVGLSNTRENVLGLSQEDAKVRRELLSNISYELFIKLEKNKSDFNGTQKIKFDLSEKTDALTIDFTEGVISEVLVDDHVVPIQYNDKFLTLGSIEPGAHEVFIRFKHEYSRSGAGLHHFVDPEDKREYLYTHFEPFDANRFFPCFDQPDLKATFQLTVDAPLDWHVISTTLEDKTLNKQRDHSKIWIFPKTPRISTYVFSLHAGQYSVYKSNFANVPLRLFIRKSLAKYVDKSFWFYITRKGFHFYHSYFDIDYPFKKYDQIIVPEFNMGAMENVGAVTFSERYISRGRQTYNQREAMASVILHEMAHMWFGDLVTMAWWNGLWLNESFATYMSSLALTSISEFKASRLSFSSEVKPWGYYEDQLVTTHPIEVEVRDTENAFTNFDGVTYAKGASALRQLDFFVGKTNFKDGIRKYLKSHAYENATLKDFMGSVEAQSGINLSSWTDVWLNKSGLNSVWVDVQCEMNMSGKRVSKIVFHQEGETLRPHKIGLEFFSNENEKLKSLKKEEYIYADKQTEFVGLSDEVCPDLVLVNAGDYDFAKVKYKNPKLWLDKVDQLEDSLSRVLIWTSLWQSVEDGQLSIYDFVSAANSNLRKENEYKVVSFLTGILIGGRRLGPSALWYVEMIGDDKKRESLVKELSAVLEHRFRVSDKKSELRKLFFDLWVQIAPREKLERIVHEDSRSLGFALDADRKWEIFIQIAARGGSLSYCQKEIKKDRSDVGERNFLACQSVVPDQLSKKKLLEQTLSGKLSFVRARTIFSRVFPNGQQKLRKEFSEFYFKNLEQIDGKKGESRDFLSSFSAQLAPIGCTDETFKNLTDFISDKGNSRSAIVLKKLKVAAQHDGECLRLKRLEESRAL
ncbi:MAG: aminopeptidase N [Bacteriovoracia bacterium]